MDNHGLLSEGVKAIEDVDLRRISELLKPDYEILGLVGSGGMGNVYLARSLLLGGKEVAVKVLHPEFVNDHTLKARFLREAELLQRVDHPGVVSFYDARTQNGIAFYVMESVRGVSLEEHLKSGSFPEDKIPDCIISLCEALHAIHSVGIVHRDFKPGNILITDSFQVKLTDFGIARPEQSQLTHHNEIVGSVCYIAPEIWIGEEPTSSVDLYSLGVVIYELLTGEVPFDGGSPGDLMRKHLQSQVVPPKSLNEKVPGYLNRLVLSLLSKSKFDRPKDALSVVESVKRAMGSLTTSHTFVAYAHDTQEFLRVVESSNTNLSAINSEPEVQTVLIDRKTFASNEKDLNKSDQVTPRLLKNSSGKDLPKKDTLKLGGDNIDGESSSWWKIIMMVLLGVIIVFSGVALVVLS